MVDCLHFLFVISNKNQINPAHFDTLLLRSNRNYCNNSFGCIYMDVYVCLWTHNRNVMLTICKSREAWYPGYQVFRTARWGKLTIRFIEILCLLFKLHRGISRLINFERIQNVNNPPFLTGDLTCVRNNT